MVSARTVTSAGGGGDAVGDAGGEAVGDMKGVEALLSCDIILLGCLKRLRDLLRVPPFSHLAPVTEYE